MEITHIALWTNDLERLRAFYEHWLEGTAGQKYTNDNTGFSSYFISFKSGVRLELMQKPGIDPSHNDPEKQAVGLVHIAFTVGDRAAVDRLTKQIKLTGFRVVGEPRQTGDGYYESTILDPDGNRIELLADG
jgi:lactoylglutathione lyase